jgi:hypothetical protein
MDRGWLLILLVLLLIWDLYRLCRYRAIRGLGTGDIPLSLPLSGSTKA